MPARALLLLGWQVRWLDEERSSLETTDGSITVGLEAGADRATLRLNGVDQPLEKPFQPAPVHEAGQLLLPLSVFERVLVIPVERDDAAGVVRLGEAPAPEATKVREWCLRLGLTDPARFHEGSGFRLGLAIPQGRRLAAGGDFLIAAWANDHACVQLFELYEGRPPVPVLGRDRTGRQLLYPAAHGVGAHWHALAPWRPVRWVLSAPPVGKVTYLAVATAAWTDSASQPSVPSTPTRTTPATTSSPATSTSGSTRTSSTARTTCSSSSTVRSSSHRPRPWDPESAPGS